MFSEKCSFGIKEIDLLSIMKINVVHVMVDALKSKDIYHMKQEVNLIHRYHGGQ